ncbi:hypothetical protein GOP47_0019107 [Adiantum capillus-veneris]|uniref:RING-type E3 ubiquitin transferase n=1 Tax=Adiantum capillus-veneris TaxID=13818 RepID=A0A9D4UFE7_ADICA|nr:hypothetical protein GOP47_0019107 [Adiantum capillus-veneris]
MRHIWLAALGVWAQAPSERGMMSDAQQSTRATNLAERREETSKAASCTGRRERHCHRCCSDGDCNLQSDCHLVNGDRHRGHCDDNSGQYECHSHKIGNELHHRARVYCKSLDEPQHTCPICLSSIGQSELTVLCWCMHRFCLTCIEKWSIMQRFCPLCKQTFHGWYYNIKSPSVFDKRDLTIKSSSQTSTHVRAQRRRERFLILRPRLSKPSPWRRTLRTRDQLRRVAEGEGDEEAVKWRASIYKEKFRAVPFIVNSRVKVHQPPLNNPERRARIERRLEPWIRRELQAITGDLDHDLLTHLVLSMWLQFLSAKEEVCGEGSSGQPHKRLAQSGFRDVDALRQLEPFLQEKASSFWHELRRKSHEKKVSSVAKDLEKTTKCSMFALGC